MNSVLMIAFHFPPFSGSSSVHRTVRFAQYLPSHGWQPVVVSAHPRAYPSTNATQYAEAVAGVPVSRAFALDARRHLSVRQVYARVTAFPDRWVSWWPGALIAGLRVVKRYRPRAIWSTYPIATAHLVALSLRRLTGIPWVADFRDPLVQDGYPTDARIRRCHRWIERQAATHAAQVVFTTEGARADYAERHPHGAERATLVIPNGYDESDMADLPAAASRGGSSGRVRLHHSGVIYPEERDPRPLFTAVSRLKREGRLSSDSLRIELRGPGSEPYFTDAIRHADIADMVEILPAVPHRAALADCAGADALLLLQGGSCDAQVPAKAYEYLRLARPILALTSHTGDTARLLKEVGGATIVDLRDPEAIQAALAAFVDAVRQGRHPAPERGRAERYDRRMHAATLARCLDAVVQS
jgi:hypothetical protein